MPRDTEALRLTEMVSVVVWMYICKTQGHQLRPTTAL